MEQENTNSVLHHGKHLVPEELYQNMRLQEDLYKRISCIIDIREKMKCKVEELESKGYSVLRTTNSLMCEALDLLCSFNSQYDSIYNSLDEGHKECIVNWGTSEYLKEWLKHDRSTYRNMHAFCQYRFSDKNSGNKRDITPDDYQKFWKSVRLVLARRIDAATQAKRDNRPYSHEFYEGQIDTSKFDLLLLWESEKRTFFSTSSDGNPDLQILTRLVDKRPPYKKRALIEDYKKYYQLFETIVPAKANGLSDTEYVVTCMQLHEIEYLYRLHLCAMIAKCMIEKEGYAPNSENCSILWSPCLIDEQTPIAPPSGNGLLEFYSYDIVDYYSQIKCAYNSSSPENKKFICLHNLQKIFTRHMIRIVEAAKPVSRGLPSWTPQDYQEDRKFYEEDMRLYRVWEQNPLRGEVQFSDSKGKEGKFADYIMKAWTLLNEMHLSLVEDPVDREKWLEDRMSPPQTMLRKENTRLRYSKKKKIE